MKDVDAVPEAMDVLRDPSEDHGRLGGGAAVDGNESTRASRPRSDHDGGTGDAVGVVASVVSPARSPPRVAMAAAREGRCASGILDARRVWSRAGHVVPVEYLYQVPLHIVVGPSDIRACGTEPPSRENVREKNANGTGFEPATTKGEGSKGRSVDRVWAAGRLSACGAAPCHPYE